MSATKVYNGFENMAGLTTDSGLFVEQIISRKPVTWAVRCTRCNTRFNARHERVRCITCQNNVCGKESVRSSSNLSMTAQIAPGVRSRDSESSIAFQHEQHKSERQVTWASQPTAAGLANADPDAIRSYLDSLGRK